MFYWQLNVAVLAVLGCKEISEKFNASLPEVDSIKGITN